MERGKPLGFSPPQSSYYHPFWGWFGSLMWPLTHLSSAIMLVAGVGVGSLESPYVHSRFTFLSGLVSFYQPHLHIKPVCNYSLLSKALHKHNFLLSKQQKSALKSAIPIVTNFQ